jgi:SAM-dependent methyltransferase
VSEWFEEWFGEEYLELYPHRDEADAARLVGLIQRTVPWRPGLQVLDVGCGAGRHAQALVDAGAAVTGIDLSRCLLDRARSTSTAWFVRADMRRIPVRPASMDLTVNLFTSFGYFASDAEHLSTLQGMMATVRPGGWFALDFLHAATTVAGLVPAEELVLGGTPVAITRRLVDGARSVEKVIQLADGRRFTERVRLFTPTDLGSMLEAAGAMIRSTFGDYTGAPLSAGTPRAILFAQRPA